MIRSNRNKEKEKKDGKYRNLMKTRIEKRERKRGNYKKAVTKEIRKKSKRKKVRKVGVKIIQKIWSKVKCTWMI